ncbi:MAG: hypothetical protein KAR35_02055 [Candidatus Heimdallarchaeota archaeon]|nr:hypothetical protein [Candidatus Heimdallarchaeota archaeon]MCK5048137.1 hypothetical protein [Candidatus Heimdallarchaeota archaeon]
MENVQINTLEHIEATLAERTTPEIFNHEFNQFKISLLLAFKTLFFSRKWLLYAILSLFPIALSLLIDEKLMGSETAEEAFIGYYLGFIFLLLFTFGCLLTALPVSSDEITDQMMDLYLVRPVRRETLWAARWVAVNVSVILVNAILALLTFFYFSLFDDRGSAIAVMSNNMDVYWQTIIFICLGSLMYTGVFLLVGIIGNKGFTFGLILALFEQFFLTFLFLENEPLIPRTNMFNLADWLYSDDLYEYHQLPSSLSVADSLIYTVIFCLGTFVLGIYYVRKKEF